MLLADLGAEVIKIERPTEPDYVRHYPPFVDGQSAYYHALNRNKRSLALDTQSAEGRDIFFQLIERSDLVLESYRPGVLDKLGIGYQAARQRNPRIIYASVTGYGQTGPYAQRAGHDLNYMAYAGLLSLQADASGRPSHPGLQIADIAGGSYAVLAGLLAALWQRDQTGEGQHVDVAMTEAVRLLAVLPSAEWEASGQLPRPGMGPLTGGLATYGLYQCRDGGWMALGALEPKFWMRFCQAAGVPEWAARLLPDADTQLALRRDLEQLFATRDQSEWTALGAEADCCLSPVLNLKEAENDGHLTGRRRADWLESEPAPALRGVPLPWKFSKGGQRPAAPAPALGKDTQAILNELGISSELQEKLRQNKQIR
jgi:crotonobetainyl-CoA:carnitine CoA-transferase CaiB-like acyl-CoA transferase